MRHYKKGIMGIMGVYKKRIITIITVYKKENKRFDSYYKTCVFVIDILKGEFQ